MQLKKISLKESKKYKLLGEALGINLDHCIEEGMLHCENFEKRAKYYVIISHFKREKPLDVRNMNLNETMIVEFYE